MSEVLHGLGFALHDVLYARLRLKHVPLRTVAAPKKPPQQAGDSFLGQLYSTEDYHVYGCAPLQIHVLNPCFRWLVLPVSSSSKRRLVSSNPYLCAGRYVTNTRIKIILVVDQSPVKEEDLRTVWLFTS